MTKIAIITDTHSGAGNDNKFLNEFFIDFHESVFFPYLKTHNIKNVIHLGDVFDRRKYVNFNTLNSWKNRVFTPLNDMCDEVHILIGNHDTYFKDTNSINSVEELLKGFDKFKIFNTATEVKLCNSSILYVPWICDENSAHTFNLIDKSSAKICMGHLELIGFELFAGHLSDKGLKSELFDKFYMTLSGHFHQKSSRGNIHYLGAPYAMMWGDYNCSRGFHVLDTDTLNLTFVENPISMYHKIYYDDTSKSYEDIMQENIPNITGKFVKIIVKKKSNPYLFDQYFESLLKLNPADISVIESTFDNESLQEVEVDETKDTLTILKECVETLDIQEHKFYLNDLLRELYIEAINSNDRIQSNG